jgi:hypothetical protein
MKIIHNKVIPFGKHFDAINIFGILFTKRGCDAYMINHEQIHTAQMRDLAYFPFYLLYFLEWIIRLMQYLSWMKAYRNISFEREAYANDHNLTYLQTRKPWSFTRYYKR